MTYRTPNERRAQWLTIYQLSAVLLIAFVLVSLLDFVLLHALTTVNPDNGRVDRSFEGEDWYRLLRIIGFIGTWIVVSIALVLQDRDFKRAIPMILAPVLSGAAAELLKLVFSRERPVSDAIIQEGGYHFRFPFSGFIDGHNLGLPSSHAAVAFGGACMLGYFLPKLRPLLILLAIGCAYSRLMTGAHFASDVFLGAIIGWGIAKFFASGLPRPDRKFTL
ncbi:MAG: phosphatase PAP2 family protein [Phycisphaerales bacterium]|nr:phosphatase PAP2 family protein [Phycisphaerales bacterium]